MFPQKASTPNQKKKKSSPAWWRSERSAVPCSEQFLNFIIMRQSVAASQSLKMHEICSFFSGAQSYGFRRTHYGFPRNWRNMGENSAIMNKSLIFSSWSQFQIGGGKVTWKSNLKKVHYFFLPFKKIIWKPSPPSWISKSAAGKNNACNGTLQGMSLTTTVSSRTLLLKRCSRNACDPPNRGWINRVAAVSKAKEREFTTGIKFLSFHHQPKIWYPEDWTSEPQFYVGSALYFLGLSRNFRFA